MSAGIFFKMSKQTSTSPSDLIAIANQAREKSEAQFSRFRVGAAIETDTGSVYSAFNIESSSYSLSICAERLALWKAITEGETNFRRIAIISDSDEFCTPCGACRQVLFELAGDIEIYLTNGRDQVKTERLSSLIPQAFTSQMLDGNH
jgi:cytidine deaminase